MKGVLPSSDWFEVRVIKKMKSGTASDGDIIDLRALSNGIEWGETTVLTTPKEISISGNTRSFSASSTPLGNDTYLINVNTTSAASGELLTQSVWEQSTYDSDTRNSGALEPKALDYTYTNEETIDSCVNVNISGVINYDIGEGYSVSSKGNIIIEIRETTLNTGVIGSWETIITQDYNFNSGSIFFNRFYDTETKVEIVVYLERGTQYNSITSGSEDPETRIYYETVIQYVDIAYSKADEILSELTGGTANWVASEV